MEDTIYLSADEIEIVDIQEYSYNVVDSFDVVPQVAKTLLKGAKAAL